MSGQAVHFYGEQLGPLCGTYVTCSALYAVDDAGREVPQWVTCRKCLRIMEREQAETAAAEYQPRSDDEPFLDVTTDRMITRGEATPEQGLARERFLGQLGIPAHPAGIVSDHLPMAAGTDRLTRFWLRLHSYVVFDAIAKDAEGEADRAAERSRDARQRADQAEEEMRRAKDALSPGEWQQVREELGTEQAKGAA